MKDILNPDNRYSDDKVIDACSLFGMMDVSGRLFSGADTIRAIANMHDRGNGLGGGFAVYGLYPDFADYYALHIMYMGRGAKDKTEAFLKDEFDVIRAEEIPTRNRPGVTNPPGLWRYFVATRKDPCLVVSDDDLVVDK
ncbi:MAG: hypothetical protein QGH23_06710, partial [Dehalococcoidia bacterium]|nr:hypothetical protein [Dehalococcoidia bacterium]